VSEEKRKLKDEIDELAGIPSERPSYVEINLGAESGPKTPKDLFWKVVGLIIALGSIAELIRQELTKK